MEKVPGQETVAARWQALRSQVEAVCARLGRDPGGITVVAVSKLHPATAVEEAMAAGVTDFGENRVQEAGAKIEAVSPRPVWHLVGHLQTNKANRAARLFDWVESVDSVRVAAALGQGARLAERSLSVLVQVNTTAEAQKSGCSPEELEAVIAAVRAEPALQLKGLMTIGPLAQTEAETRVAFARAAELREAWRGRLPADAMATLSMGMSGDWPWALEYGADTIRIGTALFGERRGADA